MRFSSFWKSPVLQQTYNIPQMIPGGVTITFQYFRTILEPIPVDFASRFAEYAAGSQIAEAPLAITIPPDGTILAGNLLDGQSSLSPRFRTQTTATSP